MAKHNPLLHYRAVNSLGSDYVQCTMDCSPEEYLTGNMDNVIHMACCWGLHENDLAKYASSIRHEYIKMSGTTMFELKKWTKYSDKKKITDSRGRKIPRRKVILAQAALKAFFDTPEVNLSFRAANERYMVEGRHEMISLLNLYSLPQTRWIEYMDKDGNPDKVNMGTFFPNSEKYEALHNFRKAVPLLWIAHEISSVYDWVCKAADNSSVKRPKLRVMADTIAYDTPQGCWGAKTLIGILSQKTNGNVMVTHMDKKCPASHLLDNLAGIARLIYESPELVEFEDSKMRKAHEEGRWDYIIQKKPPAGAANIDA